MSKEKVYSGVWDRKSAPPVNIVEPENRAVSKDLGAVQQRKYVISMT